MTWGLCEPIPRFSEFAPGLYRGGQPEIPEGLRYLRSIDVQTIVNLREDPSDVDEESDAWAPGMLINMAFDGLWAPERCDVVAIIGMLRDPALRPLFLHCLHGEDRTGLVVACYRIAVDGWTAERAIAEAREHGMAWYQFWMRAFIRRFRA